MGAQSSRENEGPTTANIVPAEFLEMAMSRSESLRFASQCASPKAFAWVRAVTAVAAVAKASTELISAAYECDLESVQDCLANGAYVDERDKHDITDEPGSTALTIASNEGDLAMVKCLLEYDADTEIKDDCGFTALFFAAIEGHTDILTLLLEAGANKEAKGELGRTVLNKASEYCNPTTVKLLLEAGADIEARDEFDLTPLIKASIGGHIAIVKLLLQAGANKEAKSIDGKTALDWALETHQFGVASLFSISVEYR